MLAVVGWGGVGVCVELGWQEQVVLAALCTCRVAEVQKENAQTPGKGGLTASSALLTTSHVLSVLCASVMQPFPKLPVPSWQLGASVGLDEFKRVTDTYYKALEPARKLRTQTLPAQVRTVGLGYRVRLGWSVTSAGSATIQASAWSRPVCCKGLSAHRCKARHHQATPSSR